MPVINRVAAYAEDMTAWRRHLHAHPELGLDCHDTAAFVADRLRAFGITDIHEGIAESGLVALIDGRGPGPTIGLRADMDALPIEEQGDAGHRSTVPGRMHACGHDGHTTMLLGAARYLAETRNFAGRVALIFQPAEEFGDGGRLMCEAGIMEGFDISRVFALHTSPYFDKGMFGLRAGPIMASADSFDITVTGRGGHAATPHLARDPIACAFQLGQAVLAIVPRDTSALDNVVVTITQVHAGTTHNVIPETATLSGTVRAQSVAARDMVRQRMGEICDGLGTAMGLRAALDYQEGLPPTINDADEAAFAARVARDIAGDAGVDTGIDPRMGAEDFSFMLERRPGAFVFVGQGSGPALHNPAFDFNDEIAPVGASYFARLVELAQPLG